MKSYAEISKHNHVYLYMSIVYEFIELIRLNEKTLSTTNHDAALGTQPADSKHILLG